MILREDIFRNFKDLEKSKKFPLEIIGSISEIFYTILALEGRLIYIYGP